MKNISIDHTRYNINYEGRCKTTQPDGFDPIPSGERPYYCRVNDLNLISANFNGLISALNTIEIPTQFSDFPSASTIEFLQNIGKQINVSIFNNDCKYITEANFSTLTDVTTIINNISTISATIEYVSGILADELADHINVIADDKTLGHVMVDDTTISIDPDGRLIVKVGRSRRWF